MIDALLWRPNRKSSLENFGFFLVWFWGKDLLGIFFFCFWFQILSDSFHYTSGEIFILLDSSSNMTFTCNYYGHLNRRICQSAVLVSALSCYLYVVSVPTQYHTNRQYNKWLIELSHWTHVIQIAYLISGSCVICASFIISSKNDSGKNTIWLNCKHWALSPLFAKHEILLPA